MAVGQGYYDGGWGGDNALQLRTEEVTFRAVFGPFLEKTYLGKSPNLKLTLPTLHTCIGKHFIWAMICTTVTRGCEATSQCVAKQW